MSINQNAINSSDNNHNPDGRKQSPPAFLDLADSAARLGTNMPDMSARVELKRLEHQRQRLLQRKMFEDQMRALEHQQAQELLSIPFDPNAAAQFAVSAPTTPPRVNAMLHGDSALRVGVPGHQIGLDVEGLSKAVGSASDKRKSVTYAPSVSRSPDLGNSNGHYGRAPGAKSMPASRRTSASEHDEELAGHLENLALAGEGLVRGTPSPGAIGGFANSLRGRLGDDDRARNGQSYNPGIMLDEQLDQEMHNAMRNLPTSDDDKYHAYGKQNTTSSAALDLAHMSQTSPRSAFSARVEKSSEWPQFSGNHHGPDGLNSRADHRTGPTLTLTSSSQDLSGKMGPGSAQLPPSASMQASSRRGSPGVLELASTRSVPATPLSGITNGAGGHLLHTPGTPLTPDTQNLSGRLSSQSHRHIGEDRLESQPSLSRLSGQYDGNFLEDQYGVESVYGLTAPLEEGRRYSSYGFESNSRISTPNIDGATGSTALYHHNGSRYGLGTGRLSDNGKMNGLHGPKHKRGDMDLNRFAGTRLEDLQGEIPALCKDQHGCRYLQKKLEEGVVEHRDMIFRETFSHFAELMTVLDPFGNYLCQKLLEYSTDEQRNLICESVAQDLVNISLNMHGTRAVQKMIDFLSTRRQIHSIILALSLHVVVLIKDLNGNHVIQKCLNKLSPEDNQFIYNAVAANCVEVATHRHGCCVLQRCIDHASDHQRIQLVNEITYNALTLVQDPYGNYVVQYVLDLNDNRFSEGVIRQFTGNVCALSVQKFSSNVIEKCIRVAEHSTRKILIEEVLNRSRLEKLLRDSYGNYCVQTALDYAEASQRALLVEGIRPVLPLIRNTPYGKRIQNKLQREQMDNFGGGYHGSIGVGNLHNSGRHLPQSLHPSNPPMADIYGGQSGLYGLQGQGSFAPSHLGPQLHGLQPSSIDPYVMQGGSPHQAGMTPSLSHGNGFAGGVSAYANASPFANAGAAGSLIDPYQRSSYGYGM
ncbi:ARM repeat-containing protein [Coniophora puteana RWD-64-598 SS2]|uniref:ARM repeat-containing protein n=1 Tax=Coniophora puteana (strain RWD-64-598) TaxID=741705 RepID=A0A5M3N4J8_CONPW|nr:ARM repeat-containing protein [Coniophora puteana RWD-64-598 SS2]EIW86350.1 ARM repeat-containing protein [Coniophora puteana RWD-64-598 SS2]